MGAVASIMKFVSPIMGLMSAFGGKEKQRPQAAAPVAKAATGPSPSEISKQEEEARRKRLLTMNAAGGGGNSQMQTQTAAPVARKTLLGQ